MERQHQGLPGCRTLVARRTDGRTVPDDVLSRQRLLPLRPRLERAKPRTHRCAGTGHILHVATRAQLGVERHNARTGVSAYRGIGTRLFPLQILHRRYQGHIPIRPQRILAVCIAHSAYDMAEQNTPRRSPKPKHHIQRQRHSTDVMAPQRG